ncbi:TBC1 domain family member 22B isoform 2 [Schistosoma japonicum]|uniref:TBC1 domain family member 22B n=1 Tax=Schistosoma japonicum TaxID=6182 RepID=C1LEA9_SCHJA|nr:TBC1 domain family member 22B [Schistosoma japonicum]KAH8876353.1 TBC1 domain family member 22B [Schistosoma japonicum]TNN19450.1 TBC1 domain family member 22B isoform 2 [Schistosoma japonicum]CAX73037.1 TBC1 domain family member 22B [Schistosoma japonicum]
MAGKGSKGFALFQINSQDVWDADDRDYLNIISPKVVQKTAQKVLELHRKESSIAEKQDDAHNTESLEIKNSVLLPYDKFPKHAPGMGVRLRASPDDCPVAQQKLLDQGRIQRFKICINSSITDLAILRQLSWSGIPEQLRPTVWKLLCDYLPTSPERRVTVLSDKRKQYTLFISQYFHLRENTKHKPMFHQIQKDLTRMTLLYRRPEMVAMFERILFVWAMRHPGSGYVQGINDLLTPFFIVFLSEYTHVDLNTSGELSLHSDITCEQLNSVEADVFWCTSHLLDTIQDNYTFAQPGLQNNVKMLASLIERIDAKLYQHFMQNDVEFLQFAFRWMNNLLIRELPLRCIIRLWDTYMSENSGFSTFHVYVCAAFLLQFSNDLCRERDFQGIILLLQHLPTFHWTDENINLILAEAFRLHSLFSSAMHHLDFRRHSDLD